MNCCDLQFGAASVGCLEREKWFVDGEIVAIESACIV